MNSSPSVSSQSSYNYPLKPSPWLSFRNSWKCYPHTPFYFCLTTPLTPPPIQTSSAIPFPHTTPYETLTSTIPTSPSHFSFIIAFPCSRSKSSPLSPFHFSYGTPSQPLTRYTISIFRFLSFLITLFSYLPNQITTSFPSFSSSVTPLSRPLSRTVWPYLSGRHN